SGLRAVTYLEEHFGVSKSDQADWARHWMRLGFESYEAQLATSPATGRFSHGDAPTIADICLVPHVFNARLLDFDFSRMPTLMRVFETCMALPAFDRAQPARQPHANKI